MIEFARMPLPTPEPARQSCRRSVVDRLADAICELGGSGEPVTEEALIARNFSPAIISRFATEARGIARRRFVKRS
ncbi:hypothetical protein [Rhizobium wuzhouense]|uniref:Uncharacterized protein n=1 Tax=Rhizobium wuzhouense TaxID=1986026 RepID=A0ABX5NMG4_9HYPH|nr:hypothetical protein [Rhizobium wuzhouense]PYB71293.1 hypothetical protein DMY87_18220 [Rhizobium wuzhouense]